MSVQVEKLEKSMAKLTITVEAAKFDAAVDSAYQKNKGKIALPGFRKGKAPRAMIEKMYGTGVFFEDAANELIPEAYETAAKESELEIVAQPEIEVTQMDKGTDFIFTATVAIKPEVTLGDYKGIEVEKKEAEVSEEEITAEIDKAREANSRLITIEDNAELKIQGVQNLVRLEAKMANVDGGTSITIRDLIKTALRMRPDRIVVGEVRGGEAVDMLQALNTGHEGS